MCVGVCACRKLLDAVATCRCWPTWHHIQAKLDTRYRTELAEWLCWAMLTFVWMHVQEFAARIVRNVGKHAATRTNLYR